MENAKKYLLDIEFRFDKVSRNKDDCDYTTNKTTL